MELTPGTNIWNRDTITREDSGSVVECLARDPGPRARASPASLCCVIEQDTFILAYWFNPGRPTQTLLKKNVDWDVKNQIKQTNVKLSKNKTLVIAAFYRCSKIDDQ